MRLYMTRLTLLNSNIHRLLCCCSCHMLDTYGYSTRLMASNKLICASRFGIRTAGNSPGATQRSLEDITEKPNGHKFQTENIRTLCTWVIFSGVKRPEREANHSLPSSAKVTITVSLVSHKAPQALRPFLIYCASPSEF
jgi:hypothetical protein